MQEKHEPKNRRRFIEDGLRAAALSGLTFLGLSLGLRKSSSSGKEASCDIDLPCRICSKLPGCQQRKALETKRKYHDSLDRAPSNGRGEG